MTSTSDICMQVGGKAKQIGSLKLKGLVLFFRPRRTSRALDHILRSTFVYRSVFVFCHPTNRSFAPQLYSPTRSRSLSPSLPQVTSKAAVQHVGIALQWNEDMYEVEHPSLGIALAVPHIEYVRSTKITV